MGLCPEAERKPAGKNKNNLLWSLCRAWDCLLTATAVCRLFPFNLNISQRVSEKCTWEDIISYCQCPAFTVQTQQARLKLVPSGQNEWRGWRNESRCHSRFSCLSLEMWCLSSQWAGDEAQVELKVGTAMKRVNCDWQEEQSNYSACQGLWVH